MGTLTAQHNLAALLETAGARPRGNRHDCSKCGGRRTVTHTEECFYCHKCQWKGNTITLMRELGIEDERNDAEKERDKRARERAHEAALCLYAKAHQRQRELRERLRELGRAEVVAHDAGPDGPNTWEILSRVYAQRPVIESELDALESADPVTVLESLNRLPQKPA